MEKEENNTNSGNFREIIALLKKALTIYVHEGQERIREEEEYGEQYPFDEYYHFNISVWDKTNWIDSKLFFHSKK